MNEYNYNLEPVSHVDSTANNFNIWELIITKLLGSSALQYTTVIWSPCSGYLPRLEGPVVSRTNLPQFQRWNVYKDDRRHVDLQHSFFMVIQHVALIFNQSMK